MNTSNDTPLPLPSNRKFGALFVVVFAATSAYLHFKYASRWALVWVAVAALLAVAAIAAPMLLAPLNRLWFELGRLLGKIVSPLVLGSIFFLVITPVALITRVFGRDELLMKKRRAATYWIDRAPPGPAPDSFRRPF
jgi:Saxitoxin biosynthesis operon protein SxtJ